MGGSHASGIALALVGAFAGGRRTWDGCDDSQLVKAVLGGHSEAFRVLVDRYKRRVYRVARRMVRDHDEADDIAQETFVRAYRALDTFDQSRRFYTWLFRIAVNLAINAADRRRRRATDSLDARAQARGFEIAGSDDLAQRASYGELSNAVGKALRDLPDGMREVFVLRTFDELSYEEISEVLGVPKGTVMSRLARARERLQTALAPYLDADAEGRAR